MPPSITVLEHIGEALITIVVWFMFFGLIIVFIYNLVLFFRGEGDFPFNDGSSK